MSMRHCFFGLDHVTLAIGIGCVRGSTIGTRFERLGSTGNIFDVILLHKSENWHRDANEKRNKVELEQRRLIVDHTAEQ